MAALFTAKQRLNIQRGLHPDCCVADPCEACGASEEIGGGTCPGRIGSLAHRLWMAAVRHDHNNDPERVLHPTGTSDATLLDEAARAILGRAFKAEA